MSGLFCLNAEGVQGSGGEERESKERGGGKAKENRILQSVTSLKLPKTVTGILITLPVLRLLLVPATLSWLVRVGWLRLGCRLRSGWGLELGSCCTGKFHVVGYVRLL